MAGTGRGSRASGSRQCDSVKADVSAPSTVTRPEHVPPAPWRSGTRRASATKTPVCCPVAPGR
jgi:hypothetical protein